MDWEKAREAERVLDREALAVEKAERRALMEMLQKVMEMLLAERQGRRSRRSRSRGSRDVDGEVGSRSSWTSSASDEVGRLGPSVQPGGG